MIAGPGMRLPARNRPPSKMGVEIRSFPNQQSRCDLRALEGSGPPSGILWSSKGAFGTVALNRKVSSSTPCQGMLNVYRS